MSFETYGLLFVFFNEYSNHIPTYIRNKDREFNILMLQLLKWIEINHWQWYKSLLITGYIIAVPGVL